MQLNEDIVKQPNTLIPKEGEHTYDFCLEAVFLELKTEMEPMESTEALLGQRLNF